MIDYILGFTNEAAAKADPVVGAYWIADDQGGGSWRGDVCIPGVSVTNKPDGSVVTIIVDGSPVTVPAPGTPFDSLWRIVIALPARNAALDEHAATQLVADRDAANAGAPMATFILQHALPLTTLQTLQVSPVFAGSNYPFG